MRSKKLTEMTVDELIERFAEIGLAQYQALDDDEYRKFNKLFGQMVEVDHALRARGQDARFALTRLYNHPNPQVRLQAAKRSLAVAPQAARQVIQAIADSKWPPQYFEAGMTLLNLDDGTFVPD
jgi:uncharacterized protein (UPF0297 family)